MAKSLEEINREYHDSIAAADHVIRDSGTGNYRKKSFVTLFSNLIFYGAIMALLLTAATYTMSGGDNPLFGYRLFNVLTGSMEGVYPKGSMVLTKQTDGREIQVGDDITFYMNQDMSVTHRVIEIVEDYDGEGNLGFRTQGVANSQPDAEPAHEYNVIGKVVWSVPYAGFVLQYMTEHLFVTMGLFALCMLISFLIRMILSESRRERAMNRRVRT